MAQKTVRRRTGRRLLFFALLGGVTWYARSRQLVGGSSSLASELPAVPPAPTPRHAFTPRPAPTPRPTPAPQLVTTPPQAAGAGLATTVPADESPAPGALSGDTVVAAEGIESTLAEVEQARAPQPLFTPAASNGAPRTNGSGATAGAKVAPSNPAATSDAAAAATPEAVVDAPEGSVLSLPDGSPPGPDYTIKGNAGSKLFHLPTSPYYERTKAEFWFRSADEAQAAGFTEWTPRKRAKRSRATR